MKILIIGYKRSGKDTLAEVLSDNFGLTFNSSSKLACEIFIYDKLKDKYGYKNISDCYVDRVNHRAEWFELINEYNKEDKLRLTKEILNTNDCYVGMRSILELQEAVVQDIFDLIIWVDAEERVGKEDEDSCNITKEYADIVIENNGNLLSFIDKCLRLGNSLKL